MILETWENLNIHMSDLKAIMETIHQELTTWMTMQNNSQAIRQDRGTRLKPITLKGMQRGQWHLCQLCQTWDNWGFHEVPHTQSTCEADLHISEDNDRFHANCDGCNSPCGTPGEPHVEGGQGKRDKWWGKRIPWRQSQRCLIPAWNQGWVRGWKAWYSSHVKEMQLRM